MFEGEFQYSSSNSYEVFQCYSTYFSQKIAETCDARQKQFMNKLLPVPDELQYIRKSETEVLLQWQNRQRLQTPSSLFHLYNYFKI